MKKTPKKKTTVFAFRYDAERLSQLKKDDWDLARVCSDALDKFYRVLGLENEGQNQDTPSQEK